MNAFARRTFLVTTAGLGSLAILYPAGNTAWFGTPPPPGLSDPLKPVMDYNAAFAPLPTHFPHRPGQHDELLDGAELKQSLKTIIGFSIESYRSGDKVWGRRAGTPAFQHTVEWVANEFKAAGLKDVKVEPFAVQGSMWVPESWQVQLIGDPAFGQGTQTITLASAFPEQGGATIPGGSLTAPLIFVGHGTDADLAGRDVKGKLAVLHVRPEPSLFGAAEQGAAKRVVDRGALGVINVVEGPANIQYFDGRFACGTSPCFMVGGQDGWFLEQVIGKAADAGMSDRLQAKVSLTAGEKSGLTSYNVVASIPGESAKRIIINAHADAFFQGADDNGSGLATLVGLARYLAKGPKPKHTLLFVASGGHHGPGNGPAALVQAHPELKQGTLLIVNLEHVAYSDVVRGKTRATNNFGMVWNTSVSEGAKAVGITNLAPFLIDVWSAAPRCFGVTTYEQVLTAVSGDLGGYRSLEVPMTQMIQSGTFYHSSGDVYEEVPAEGLERAARFYAYLVRQVDSAPENLLSGAAYTPSPNKSVCSGIGENNGGL